MSNPFSKKIERERERTEKKIIKEDKIEIVRQYYKDKINQKNNALMKLEKELNEYQLFTKEEPEDLLRFIVKVSMDKNKIVIKESISGQLSKEEKKTLEENIGHIKLQIYLEISKIRYNGFVVRDSYDVWGGDYTLINKKNFDISHFVG